MKPLCFLFDIEEDLVLSIMDASFLYAIKARANQLNKRLGIIRYQARTTE